MKPRAELFDIATKKDDQRRHEMAMTPEERLRLCLDLMDFGLRLHPNPPPPEDGIQWIELPMKDDR